MHIAGFLKYTILTLAVILIALMPFIGDNYLVRFFTLMCMYAALALSWNFIGGYAGYPSFATAAFFGLGAYLGAIGQNHSVPMVAAWLLATAGTAVFAAALGYAILRLRGHYFAVGSIAVVELLRLIASTWRDVTGGGMGMNVPILPGGPDYAGRVFLYAMLTLALIVLAVTIYVDRNRLGFGLRCIQQNEDAANMVGINADAYKIAAFILSGMFCGGAGAIYASWVAYIDPPDVFNILTTLKIPVMALLGGAGTVFGPLVGVFVFQTMEELIWSNFLDLHSAVLGIIIVVLVFYLPGGLLRMDYRRLLRRFARKPAEPAS
jgi:branched-chain amino acid transport system permease protein